jgi:hypothetical protein
MRLAVAAVLGMTLTLLTASEPAFTTPGPPILRPAQDRPEQSRGGARGSGGIEGPAEAAVPFKVGETLTYDVSWSSFLVAGSAVMKVSDRRPSDNATAYYIVVEGRPLPILARLYNLYYKMDSLLDTRTLLSQRGSLYSEEGKNHQLGTTRFDRTAKQAIFERKDTETVTSALVVPPETQDGLAFLYALRARTHKAGDRVTVPVADSGSLYTVSVAVAALEKIRVPLDEFSAWQLNASIVDAQGQPVWKNIVVWMTNDARRLPVKLQAELPVGQFVLALRDAR